MIKDKQYYSKFIATAQRRFLHVQDRTRGNSVRHVCPLPTCFKQTELSH